MSAACVLAVVALIACSGRAAPNDPTVTRAMSATTIAEPFVDEDEMRNLCQARVTVRAVEGTRKNTTLSILAEERIL